MKEVGLVAHLWRRRKRANGHALDVWRKRANGHAMDVWRKRGLTNVGHTEALPGVFASTAVWAT